MKRKIKQLFSLSNTDKEYCCDNQKKFNFVSCQSNGIECKSTLSEINNNYLDYIQHYRSKNYSQSINELKSAFYKTSELKKPSCQKCRLHFRSTIIQSLENIHDELAKMSTGIFKTKRFNINYFEAQNMLVEFKNSIHGKTIPININKKHVFKTYREKHVV